ncbi:hypothetical protein [Yinghuangia sp. YIM S09857]|uniref:hypothetical protein n=1 Tax=Yinghuangia sp. YIM S09857 TaxID=3436929 RepID=UPI003F53969C
MFAVDVAGASKMPEGSRRHLPHAMYEVVKAAFEEEGIRWEEHVLQVQDGGDGFLAVLPERLTAPLVDSMRALDDMLRANRDSFRGPPMRMRAAIHHGRVPRGRELATPLIELFRMLDSDDLRGVLKGTRSCVAVMLSDHVYRMVVHGRHVRTVEGADFVPMDISPKGMRLATWVHTPARDVPPPVLRPQRRPSIDLKPVKHEAFMEQVDRDPNLRIFLPPKSIGPPSKAVKEGGGGSPGGADDGTTPVQRDTRVPWRGRPLAFDEPARVTETLPAAAAESTRGVQPPPPGSAQASDRGLGLGHERGR